jgi:ABC-2 type transport system ATP-binding protein/lipopolysaccharide transport system ATP-binding protein
MVYIACDKVTVEFPIYSANTRSLKSKVMNFGSGGRLSRDANNRLAVVALRDVSASLQHGDRVGLIGRNGAGKTTLLRVLAGVYEPSYGSLVTQGQVASLFDVTLGMDAEGTGYENIVRRGMLLGLTHKQINGRLDDIVNFTELGDYLAVPVRTYSSGMLLRLAFAISTTIDPEILLMDEWLGVGDSQFLKKAEARLESLVARSGIMVIASHSNDLIRRVCNKVIHLEKGQVVKEGPTEEVLAEYEAAAPPGSA